MWLVSAAALGAGAHQVSLDVSLANPVLKAGESQKVYLKVGLTGLAQPEKSVRAPVNMALVIDKSGSMGGEKIRQARAAALSVLDRLRDEDIMKEGIAVSTIGLGLGFNEDLMVRLARESDGNHAFVEHADDLVAIFDREFGEATSVVAKDVEIRIECSEPVRPIRVLGRPAEVSGRTIIASLNRVLSGQERYVMIEMEVPAGKAEESISVASVTATYHDLETSSRSEIAGTASARFTASGAEVEKNVKKEVMAEAVMQIGAEASVRAVLLRDEGKVEEARQTLEDNTEYLNKQAEVLESDKLRGYAEQNVKDAEDLDTPRWNAKRKEMRDMQYSIESQQAK